MSKPRDIFHKVEIKLTESPDHFAELKAAYKFVVAGPEGGTWIIDLREETFGVRESEEEADCTFHMQDNHFVDLFTGKLPPENALLTGKVKVSGDVLLAMKFGQMMKK